MMNIDQNSLIKFLLKCQTEDEFINFYFQNEKLITPHIKFTLLNDISFKFNHLLNINHNNELRILAALKIHKYAEFYDAIKFVNYIYSDEFYRRNLLMFMIILGYEELALLALDTLDNNNINYQDNNEVTALMYAAKNNSLKLIVKLIKLGADVNKLDNMNSNALHYTTSSEVMNVLIDNGANCNQINLKSETIILRACKKYFSKELIKKILLKLNKTNNINIRKNNNYSPLDYAIIHQDLELVQLLIEYDADVNLSDEFGFRPIHIAASYSTKTSHHIIKILLKNKAHKDVVNIDGETPYDIAQMKRIDKNIDMNNEETSCDIAQRKQIEKNMKLLSNNHTVESLKIFKNFFANNHIVPENESSSFVVSVSQ
jgi:ankyrin repeat protein